VPEVTLALVYFDFASHTEVELRQVYRAEELEQILAKRCAAFIDWTLREAAHQTARDASLEALVFREDVFRPGRRDLAEALSRAATGSPGT